MTAAKRLLTFAEVADLLGETGTDRVRRVRRRLQSHERASDLLVRIAHPKRARYFVSLSALRLYLPQMKDHANDVVSAVREELGEMDDRIQEAREETRALAKLAGDRIRALESEVARLRREFAALHAKPSKAI